jgi:hypothetical protein
MELRTPRYRRRSEPRSWLSGGSPAIRWILGIAAGAAIMLSVATVDATTGAKVPLLGNLAALPAPAISGPALTPGTCLTWKQADAADLALVDCAQPHLFEQVASVDVSGQDLTDDKSWRQMVNERCTPLVVTYLNGKYDPNGRFRSSVLRPSTQSWNDGNRMLRCGLQAYSRSGALYPITGKVEGQDQARIQPAGTCLGVDGRAIADPIDCAKPHAVESVGSVDLSAKFKDAFPSVDDQDKFLQPECAKLAGDYAGGADVITKKKLVVYWDNLTQESWTAGTRKVACNLAALLKDPPGFAPVTGSVKGEVTVSDKAAPPAEQVQPGAPAPEIPAGVGASTPTPGLPSTPAAPG